MASRLSRGAVDTFYRDREGGRWVWFSYDEGRRVFLNAEWAARQVERGTATLVTL